MMESIVLNQSNITEDRLDHLKCGEVITWQCAGEMYAVECKLCEDHPLCPLSEFPQHMEIWHTDWQEDLQTDNDHNEDQLNTDDNDEEEQFFDYEDDDDHALSFTTEDSGCLFESDDHSSQNDPTNNNNTEEILQPFEQVLIEQETINPVIVGIQIREDGAEECFREVNKQVAEVLADVTEKKQEDQKSNFNINKNLNERKDKQNDHTVELAETEKGLRYLQEITESEREFNVRAVNVNEEHEHVKQECKKFKKSRTFLKNIKEIEEPIKKLRENETKEEENSHILEKYQVYNINDKKSSENDTKTTEIESETSENETNNLERLKKFKNSLKNYANPENILITCRKTRHCKRKLKENTELNENETEISENETKDLENIKTIKKTEKTQRKCKENVIKPRESKELRENATETGKNETETSENETQSRESGKTKKSIRHFRENSTKSKDFKEPARKLRHSKELKENETEMSENETATSEIEKETTRHFRENSTKSKDFKETELKENETVTSEIETETSENETETSELETETSENGRKSTNDFKNNKNSKKEPARKLKHTQEKNETEISENETETSEIETQTSENKTETSWNGRETINKPNDFKNCKNFQNNLKIGDSFQNTPQNLTKIKKFSINLRKSIRDLQKTKSNLNNDYENSPKIRHTATNKRKLAGNREIINEEEREEGKHDDSGANESETNQKLPKFQAVNRIKSHNSGKTRISKSNLRKCSRDSSEMEREERESLDLHKNVENLQENLENYTNYSLVSSTNSRRTRKSNNETSKRSNEEQEINESDFSSEGSVTDCTRPTKRKLQNYKSEIENLELRTSEDLKLTQDILRKPTRKSCRTSQRRKTSKTYEVLTPRKRSRRESSSETLETLEEIRSENSLREEHSKTSKQTLVTQFFKNKNIQTKTLQPLKMVLRKTDLEISQNSEDYSINNTPMDVTDTSSLNSFDSSQDLASSRKETLSPLSSKTDEEHFEFDGPIKEQLNQHHISHLIKLYQEHPRLWEQAHPEFCEPQLCRKSWQQITEQWNEFCQRQFTIAEVRIRLGTLCQRYVQERERLALEGELDEFAKFPYYEQMQFLEQQESLQKRSELYEQQNEKILKIYQLFPLLWHLNCYKLRQSKDRAEAFENISQSLKLSGLHLSSKAVQKRIRSLRKCYRLEKIRFLHAQVEQSPFESRFCHYERMKFLHKHIEPFRCRICGRIFENLARFREHLEQENHGDLLQEDSESEQVGEEEEKEDILENLVKEKEDTLKSGNSEETLDPVAAGKNNLLCFSDLQSSSDILQTFSPLPASPLLIEDSSTNLNLVTAPLIQEVIIFPPPTPAEPFIDSLHLENQLMEEIMENVSNDDSFSQKSLDQFINSVTSSEVMSPNGDIIEESLTPDFMNTGIEELSDNNIIIEEPLSSDIMEAENPIIFAETQDEKDQTFEVSSSVSQVEENLTEKLAGSQETKLNSTEKSSSPSSSPSSPLVVKVQCDDFSLDLKLNSPPYEILHTNTNDSDNEANSSGDISTAPLPDQEIHKMIALYRKYPQIWNPNHLDYNSRNLRRQAWCQLTKEFSAAVGKQFSWRTLHRKLTDYAKYYKKLITEQENYEELENKWAFYEDFKFLDDVLVVHDELQRSVHHRDNNFKIIKIYETLPQLWDIKHPDFSKRSSKQRLIEVMCTRLQEEYNLQLTTERLKHRLIELRAQYRAAKKQRLKCERNQQDFQTDFEFYEAFKFLDPHIDPFICDKCGEEFKKLTDFNVHVKREHDQILKKKPAPLTLLPLEPGVDKNLQNICHICGLKFTTRSNLVHHVRRHEGERNYACPMCPKKFFASHPLKVHIRSHTKECPYTCEKCGMSFVSASKLNQHVKRHLDKKDFQCEYCPKRFYTGFEKDRHERRHLNIRDKVCPVCGKTFVVGSSYYAHMMLHSDTKRFECEVCEMKFAQYAGLYKHKKKYHPT